MTRIHPHRRSLFNLAILMSLIGILIAMSWHQSVDSRIASFGLSHPLAGERPPDVQLEPPSKEGKLDGEGIIAEEPGELEWVESGNPNSIPLLVRYLKSQEEVVQRATLAELAEMGAKAQKAVPAIVAALQDSNSSIRVEAAVTLIHLNVQVKAAVRTLALQSQSQDAVARARAARAIEQLVNPPRDDLGTSCWGPEPPPRMARPWVKRAVDARSSFRGFWDWTLRPPSPTPSSSWAA
jgi:hypothetical protein